MPLTVSYKKEDRIGHYTLTQTNNDGTISKFRIDMCKANCLSAMIWFNKDEATLITFFADLQHAKNILKDTNIMNDCDNFVFRSTMMSADLWKLVQLLVKHGKKVTIK